MAAFLMRDDIQGLNLSGFGPYAHDDDIWFEPWPHNRAYHTLWSRVSTLGDWSHLTSDTFEDYYQAPAECLEEEEPGICNH